MSDPEILSPTNPPVPPSSPSSPNTMFRGPGGIRAGWRVLIFLALIAVEVIVVVIPFALLAVLRGDRQPRPAFAISGITPLALSISEGAIFLFPAIAALIMAWIEHRKFGDYGLPPRSAFGKDFRIGVVVASWRSAEACSQSSPCTAFTSPAWRFVGARSHPLRRCGVRRLFWWDSPRNSLSVDIFNSRSRRAWDSGRRHSCSPGCLV